MLESFWASYITAYVQLDSYSSYDYTPFPLCWQLFSCGNMVTYEAQRQSTCALLSIQNQADLFAFDESNRTCHICQDTSPTGSTSAFHGSLRGFVKGKWMVYDKQPSLYLWHPIMHVIFMKRRLHYREITIYCVAFFSITSSFVFPISFRQLFEYLTASRLLGKKLLTVLFTR